jgi:thioredoxin reductase (NADPH)
MRVIVLDATAAGGQAGTSSRIENYLGFPSGISGAELAERAVLQARKFGARFAVPAEATSIEQDDGHYRVRLGDGTSLTSTLVVLATGVRYRRLDVPRADYFEKMSIYYAAPQAEALLCAGDPVAIVGGGNSRGRRRSSCPRTPPRSRSSSASTTWASTCPATSSTRSPGSSTCTS